jgi:hypothetical protein
MLKSNPARTEEYLSKYETAKDLVVNQRWSLTKASTEVGIDRRALSRSLKEEGYKVINYHNLPKFDENIFDVIDTEDKAYWLGFLYADGAVSLDRNTIELSLKSSDVEHLKKFRDFLGFEKNKKIYQDKIRCRIQITNKHLKQQLIFLGCFPQKSLNLKFPTLQQVPSHLHRHFIRGYVDGDGSVMLNTRRNAGRINILGTKHMLQNILTVTGWRKNKISQHGKENVYSVEWAGYYVTSYLDYLYKDASIYLDRKYKRYLMIKDMA